MGYQNEVSERREGLIVSPAQRPWSARERYAAQEMGRMSSGDPTYVLPPHDNGMAWFYLSRTRAVLDASERFDGFG